MVHNLIVSPPGEDPVLYELNAKRIGLGRDPENQIRIDREFVSSSHLEIRRIEESDEFEIEDLGSKNGSRLNGKRLKKPEKLSDGDRLLISETVPIYFVALAEGRKPEPAAARGDEKTQKAAATYVSLDEKLHELEEKLGNLRNDVLEKEKEHESLENSIAKLKSSIDEGGKEGQDVEEMEKDLMNKTRQVSVLKEDLEGAKQEIEDLEATRKVAVKASDDPPPPPSSAPEAPKAPTTPRDGNPLPRPVPKKPGSSNLPPARPKKPGGGSAG